RRRAAGGGRPDDADRTGSGHRRALSDRTVFLVNPAAENGAVGKRWPELQHRIAQLGLPGEALLSAGPGELGGLARRAADEGATLVVAVGGDGTVNEVAQGLAGRDGIDLAVIPRGTGWDFVRTYGIPRKLEAA